MGGGLVGCRAKSYSRGRFDRQEREDLMGAVRQARRPLVWAVAAGFLALAAALTMAAGSGQEEPTGTPAAKRSNHISSVVSLRAPFFTPKNLTSRLQAVRAMAGGEAAAGGSGGHARGVFNDDVFGLPQNEESVDVCSTRPNVVIEGTNDYRGLIDPEGNFTGWHLSINGGRSLRNEGLLPPVQLLSDPARQIPSGGDPVNVAGETNEAGTARGCTYLYAASLAYNPADPFGDANGVAVYRSTPEILASCDTTYPNSANPECWPTRRLVAEAEAGSSHFLDKEWFDVGVSGGAGEVVWVTYSDFVIDFSAPLGFTGAEIFAVRCDRNLVTCTSPIPISEDDGDVQFSDVTVAPDGKVYVTWAQIIGELPSDPEFPEQTFVFKMRVAEPGSTVFGPEQIVHVEDKPIPFAGFLHANDFRVATYPKHEVVPNGGGQRTFVVWDRCIFRPLAFICEEPEILLKYSDNDGATWSDPISVSRGGDNYFPALRWNEDRKRSRLALTWFTNRFDRGFHNAQDVEYTTLDTRRIRVAGGPMRLTRPSNETEADPLLGGVFIGDYIDVAALGRTAWIGFNANYRHEQLLGPFGVEGIPVPQQDNYLSIRPVP
jgi:hypothetical protein